MNPRPAHRRQLIIAEPPPRFRVSPPLTVDCSVIAALLFAEPRADEARTMIANRNLHAPTLIDYEIVNVATRKANVGFESQVEAALGHYAGLAIDFHAIDLAETLAIARRYAISAYDAAYLWLAGFLKTPLATFDARLGKAAQRYLGSLGKG